MFTRFCLVLHVYLYSRWILPVRIYKMVQQWKNHRAKKNSNIEITMKCAEQSSRCDKSISMHTALVYSSNINKMCVYMSIDPCSTITCICLRFIYNFLLLFVASQKKSKKFSPFISLFLSRIWRKRKYTCYTFMYSMRSKLQWLNFIRFVVMKYILKWSVPLLQTILVVSMRWFEAYTRRNVGSYCKTRYDVTHHLNRFRPYQSTLRAKLNAYKYERKKSGKKERKGADRRVKNENKYFCTQLVK